MGSEENKSGASEALEKGANAANAIRGAVKTGKAIAGISKGAAAGGPYGAAAAFLWQNRKTVVKIIAAAAFIFMLPVLFILMLPAIIFGDFDADTADDIPVMNDNTAIMKNVSEAETTVGTILQTSYEKVLTDIEAAIAELPDNNLYEVIDPYEDEIFFNSDLIISQYCASKDNYDEINISDLKNKVEESKDNLFTYEAVANDIESKDSDGNDITITMVTYTVVYSGDSYFADSIFNLTDEQKDLALEYAENLSIFLDANYNDQASTVHESLSELLKTYPHEWTDDKFNSPFADMEWKPRVTSEFGKRVDPITGAEGVFHTGIDIAFPKGTEIHAAKSGVVVISEKKTTGYGYRIVVNHGGGYSTLYAHCSELLVSIGDTVSVGDVIAKVGTTGRSTGNHLHFEVIKDGVTVNPRDYID